MKEEKTKKENPTSSNSSTSSSSTQPDYAAKNQQNSIKEEQKNSKVATEEQKSTTEQQKENQKKMTEEQKNNTEQTEAAPAPMTSKERISEANHIVKNRMIASVGAGLIPFPVVDIVALTGIQLDTVRALCKLYNIQFSKDIGKTAVTTLTGGVVPVVSAPWVSSLAKTIPFVGQIVGAASMPIIAGASTYAVGKVFIQHFESGGTFLTFDPEKVKGYFKEEFEKGKEFAKNEAKAS